VKKQENKHPNKRTEGFIDLASTMHNAKSANAIYQCPECTTDLIKDASFQVKNPFTHTGSDPFIKVKFNTQTVLPPYQSFNIFGPYQ
jgi:hypothetical protein